MNNLAAAVVVIVFSFLITTCIASVKISVLAMCCYMAYDILDPCNVAMVSVGPG